MTLRPAIWSPIAALLGALNLVGVGFAAASAEPWHAGIHATLALGFGLWAERLWRAPRGSDRGARLEALEAEVSGLRRELAEARERLDFAERVLAQGAAGRRLEPER